MLYIVVKKDSQRNSMANRSCDAIVEIERYIVNPCHAGNGLQGWMERLRLREEASTDLGDQLISVIFMTWCLAMGRYR